MNSEHAALTGRIQQSPSQLYHEEVLEPQFRYELQHLLPFYCLTEAVIALEYEAMGFLTRPNRLEIGALLQSITPDVMTADPKANMSDIAFAIERYVESRLTTPVPAWHIDRSRNDFQACAQVMFGRSRLLAIARQCELFGQAVYALADRTADMVMPGYTHHQGAQVISPGFYLSAMLDQINKTLGHLLFIYHSINRCPLGAGPMAGLELPWDRARMAEHLAFEGPQEHALVSVAARDWATRSAAELSLFGVTLSRFATDFLHWGSSDCGFIDLPDELSGISSAMPQKKNFPILERIRGKTAHLTAFATDLLLGQRSTPFTNLVEVSKEAGAHAATLFATMESVLRLFTAVVQNVTFQESRMQVSCEREFFGGMSLANALTIRDGINYRQAQKIAGTCIVLALDRGLAPNQVDGALLAEACRSHECVTTLTDADVHAAFDVYRNLQRKQTAGATGPAAVRSMLGSQSAELARLGREWEAERISVDTAYRNVQSLVQHV